MSLENILNLQFTKNLVGGVNINGENIINFNDKMDGGSYTA